MMDYKGIALKEKEDFLHSISPLWDDNEHKSARVVTSLGHVGTVHREHGMSRARYKVYKEGINYILAYPRSITVLEYLD